MAFSIDSMWGWVAALTLTALAFPHAASGFDPKEYYGGFFPTEAWVDGLEPIPRAERRNPFQQIRLVKEQPEGKDAWESPVILLSEEQLEGLKRDVSPYMKLNPSELIGLVPRRNRISGNSRVMRATRMPLCPNGDAGSLLWSPDRPDAIRCTEGHLVDPFELFPPTGVFRITGPKGDVQEYPYHDAPDGTRVYLHGEYMDPLRVHYLAHAARKLGILFLATENPDYAGRAAAILYDFTCAVPHWPKIHRGRPGVEGAKRFRPISEYTVYAGIWYDKYHTGLAGIPSVLALAYDKIVNASVWEPLDRAAPGGDARALIEHDLFLYSAKDAIRYDIRYPKPSSVLSNYIPYQIKGMLCIGRAVGVPELVHYANWKLGQLAEKTLLADSVFPESPSYGRQHIYGMAKGCRLAQGYTDPPGFVSSIDGKRFDDADMSRDVPELCRAVEALESMVYPDDGYIMVHDTWSKLVSSGHPAPEKTRSILYPAFGHAVLARGERKNGSQIQAHLHYSGNWGHDHHDMLGFILWAYKDEFISDIGYAHTYRMFANNASGHNLVVVDRYPQNRVADHGRLLGWHPVEDGLQVVEASGSSVYPQCSTYRRALFLIPIGEMDTVVLDIFSVAGGSTHEWMAQGSCLKDQTLKTSIPTTFFADSYADDGKPFTPPAHNEWVKELYARQLNPNRLEKDPWYGVFRDVHRGKVSGPFAATFLSQDEALPDVRLHMVEPTDAELYTCMVPSLRRCWSDAIGAEDHSLVERFRMPKLIVRRDGENLQSRFTALWEPTRAGNVIQEVNNLTSDDAHLVALEIRAAVNNSPTNIRVFYQADPSRRRSVGNGGQIEGRYASVITDTHGKEVVLYDCSHFSDGDITVSIQQRPALPVEAVVQEGEERFSIRLDGTWKDIPDDGPLVFAKPEMVLMQVGEGQRVFPVNAVETKKDKTFLHCTHSPGFAYDAESHVLKDVVFPFLSLQGRAAVILPNRVRLRADKAEPAALRVHTTNPMTINSRRVEQTHTWVTIPR